MTEIINGHVRDHILDPAQQPNMISGVIVAAGLLDGDGRILRDHGDRKSVV